MIFIITNKVSILIFFYLLHFNWQNVLRDLKEPEIFISLHYTLVTFARFESRSSFAI